MKFNFKLILEIIPTLVFLVFYHTYDLPTAIYFLLVTSIISFLLILLKNKKVSLLLLFSTSVLTIFGGCSLIFEDTIFFKIKPTITYSFLGIFLIFDLMTKKGVLAKFMRSFVQLNNDGYKFIQLSVIAYCFAFSLLNEILWRNYTEETWVYFKMFGIPVLNIVFTITVLTLAVKKPRYQESKY